MGYQRRSENTPNLTLMKEEISCLVAVGAEYGGGDAASGGHA